MGGKKCERPQKPVSSSTQTKSSEMQIHPGEKIKGKVTRLWIVALELMPTVVDLSPSSARYAVVSVERQHTLGNETLLGWRASPEKKMKMKEK